MPCKRTVGLNGPMAVRMASACGDSSSGLASGCERHSFVLFFYLVLVDRDEVSK